MLLVLGSHWTMTPTHTHATFLLRTRKMETRLPFMILGSVPPIISIGLGNLLVAILQVLHFIVILARQREDE
jgi:hypothetical protein